MSIEGRFGLAIDVSIAQPRLQLSALRHRRNRLTIFFRQRSHYDGPDEPVRAIARDGRRKFNPLSVMKCPKERAIRGVKLKTQGSSALYRKQAPVAASRLCM